MSSYEEQRQQGKNWVEKASLPQGHLEEKLFQFTEENKYTGGKTK